MGSRNHARAEDEMIFAMEEDEDGVLEIAPEGHLIAGGTVTELDADTLNAILVRLVGTGTAEQLGLCSCVSRTWYAGALNDELWGTLLVRRWGPLSQEGHIEPPMSYRSRYIRSVTTQVLVWGQGAWQQDGVQHRTTAVLELSGVKSVSAGAAGLSSAVTWDGRVVCWGDNSSGQCSVPASAASFLCSPVSVELAPEFFVLQVSCGTEHVGCVCHCGALFCWGSNDDGQLGGSLMPDDEDCLFITQTVKPVLAASVPMMHHTLNAGAYIQVACGAQHTVALVSHGAVFAWGCNTSGQCGRMVADQDSTEVESRASTGGLVEPLIEINVSRVAAGNNFTLAAAPGLGVFSFGANGFGQLGRETEIAHDSTPCLVDLDPIVRTEPVLDMCCGDDHSIMTLTDRSVWVWGRGTQAALGLGAQTKNALRPQPLPCSGDVKSALFSKSGTTLSVAAGGANSGLLSCAPALPRPVPLPQLRGQVGIDVSGPWRDTASQLFTWGANKFGELGHGDTAKRTVPRVVKMLKGGMGGVGGVTTATNTNTFAVSLGGSHAVALMEWRAAGAAGRGFWGGGTPSDSVSSSYTSSTPGTPSTPGSFSSPGWPGQRFSLSRSCPEGATFDTSVSPPAAKALDKATPAFNSGYPAKGGHKQRYSAGGGRNCREIRTPKTPKKKEANESKKSGGRKESRRGGQVTEARAEDEHAKPLREDDGRPLQVRSKDLRSQLHAFKASDATQLDMDPALPASDRSRVHQMCDALGLSHLSIGEGAERHVRITKPLRGQETTSSRARGACRGAALQQAGRGGSSSDEVDEWAAEAARYSSQGGFHELEWHSSAGPSSVSGRQCAGPRRYKSRGRRGAAGRESEAGVEHDGGVEAGAEAGSDRSMEAADEGVLRRLSDGGYGWLASRSV